MQWSLCASSASFVVIAPPSPKHPRFFDGKKDVHPTLPIVPLFGFSLPCSTPFHCAPIAWALSSTTYRLCFAAISIMRPIFAHWPNRCTGTMAFVRGVMASSIFWGSILNVSHSTSTSTGTSPRSAITSAVATYVNAGTIISSPLCSPSDIRAICSASVPFAQVIACAAPVYPARLAENSLHLAPFMNCAAFITFCIWESTSSFILRYCPTRSTILMFIEIIFISLQR